MKIIVAPNSLKGSLSAIAAAKAMKQGINMILPQAEVLLKPIADGGDGFAEILANSLSMDKKLITVTGPLGESIEAPIYFSHNSTVAIIEVATIAGLALVAADNRNPLLTTTVGVGEAIKYALDSGVERIIIGVGGSATNDAGIGMASALGARFLNCDGEPVKPIGRSLIEIVSIDTRDMDARLGNITIDVACDVDNPFYGENGAAYIFAEQKGATQEQVVLLDKGLRQFAKVIGKTLDLNLNDYPGAGAAGGIGGTLMMLCNAHLRRGIDIVLDAIEFNAALEDANLVLTAEGQIDSQTNFGKAPAGVAMRARKYNVPCIVLAGSTEFQITKSSQSGITAVVSICPGPVTLETAMQNAFEYISATTEQVVRIFMSGRRES